MSAASAAKPPRPCTEYNIFFQLERAYILQHDLQQSDPDFDSETFRPTQPSYADLPALPDRYADLALPYDWFLPGKEQRRKRKHRKSHGAIGFHELSHRVSAAWEAAGADVRAYCSEVCAAGKRGYKTALAEWKANGAGAESEASAPRATRPRSTRQAAAAKANARRGRRRKKAAVPEPQESVSSHDMVNETTNLRGGTHQIQYDEEVLCLPLPPLPQVAEVPASTQTDVISVEQMNDVFAQEIGMLGLCEPFCFEPEALSSDACISMETGTHEEMTMPRSPSVVSYEPVPAEVSSAKLEKDADPNVRMMRQLFERELAQRGAQAEGKHAVAAWAA